MKTEPTTTAIMVTDTLVNEPPFVNEECGDTMWDEVLKSMEAKPEKV